MRADPPVVKQIARLAGFDLAGIASAEPFTQARAVALQRLGDGLMGQLPWYTEARVLRGTDPQAILTGARSIIAVGCSYSPTVRSRLKGGNDGEGDASFLRTAEAAGDGGPTGKVARYAWGRDYHIVLKKRLKLLVRMLEEQLGAPFAYKLYVDDGPMLDREVARRAGLGFTGKNTNVLTPIGSWVFLGQIVTDLEIAPDRPLRRSCGSCTACMPACPTSAITSAYTLDSNKCIAYLTIEHRGPIPRDLRPLMGDWVFGCDICQEVCPVNHRRAQPASAPIFQARNASLDLMELLDMDEAAFKKCFAGTPIMRAKLVGMQRNACVALGNLRNADAVPALMRALLNPSPLVRGHAAWALGRVGTPEARQALRDAPATEADAWVREEITAALGGALPV